MNSYTDSMIHALFLYFKNNEITTVAVGEREGLVSIVVDKPERKRQLGRQETSRRW